jgi:imidazolonepropionase-like amidohydrolase
MTKKGVTVSINSDSAEHARRLNTEAAKSMRYGGLTEDEAIAMVTINPAKQLRIDNRVGSLETGKDGDVVIWNHHPLSSYAIVERVYIDGQKYYDRMDDQQRLTELARAKSTLTGGEERRPTTTEQPRAGSGGPSADDSSADGARSVQSGAGQPADSGAFPPTKLQSRGVLAITNAKIVPVSRPVIERGTIVIRDGLIADIGANVSVPAGAQVIDAGGAEVYPGFIDARTDLGLTDPGAGGFSDANEILDFNPQLRPNVAFHNDSDAIPVARASGITTVALTPSGGLLGGQVAVMDLDGWTYEESTVVPSVGVSFQFPSIGGGGRGGGFGAPPQDRTFDDLKKERDARLDRVAKLLDDARAYAKAAGPNRPRDLQLESLVPIVERRLPLITQANNERSIRDAVAFADRAKVRMVIAAGPEAALVAPLLKEKNIPVILTNVLDLPSREDLPHQASYAAAAELARTGVKFTFAVTNQTNVRLLPYNAAMSVAWGLSREDALKALTLNAAEILGLSDRLGSLETGKIGNLFIAKGDPLEVRTPITHVVIAGRNVPLDNKHLALYERYMKRQ